MCECGKNSPSRGGDLGSVPNPYTLEPNKLKLISVSVSMYLFPLACQAGEIWICPGVPSDISTDAKLRNCMTRMDSDGAYLNACFPEWSVLYKCGVAQANLPVGTIPLCCEPAKSRVQSVAKHWGDHWLATARGQNFVATNSDIDALIAAEVGAFDATKPTLLLDNPADSGLNIPLDGFSCAQDDAGTAMVKLLAVVDVVVRRSGATGTAAKQANCNVSSNRASPVLVFERPTAIAASAARQVGAGIMSFGAGAIGSLEFEHGVALGPGHSLLVYAFTAGVAPKLAYNLGFGAY